MTPTFLVKQGNKPRKTGFKEMAMFGLRKIFVDPAPRPQKINPRLQGFLDGTLELPMNWLPE